MDWTDVEMELSAWGREDLAVWAYDEVASMRARLDAITDAADDACELLEMTGMHDESAYKQLKQLVINAATWQQEQRIPTSAQQP